MERRGAALVEPDLEEARPHFASQFLIGRFQCRGCRSGPGTARSRSCRSAACRSGRTASATARQAGNGDRTWLDPRSVGGRQPYRDHSGRKHTGTVPWRSARRRKRLSMSRRAMPSRGFRAGRLAWSGVTRTDLLLGKGVEPAFAPQTPPNRAADTVIALGLQADQIPACYP